MNDTVSSGIFHLHPHNKVGWVGVGFVGIALSVSLCVPGLPGIHFLNLLK